MLVGAKTAELLEMPLKDWDAAFSGPKYSAQEVERECACLIHAATRLMGYAQARGATGCGDHGHRAAVKEQNKLVAKIRKAMGYTMVRNDIDF